MSAFAGPELHALREWVEHGGSLLIIADHPPFSDSATALGQAFGFEFIGGAALQPSVSGQFNGIAVFDVGKGLMPTAPSRGRYPTEQVDSVMTFTGSAFRAPPGDSSELPNSRACWQRSAGWGNNAPPGTPAVCIQPGKSAELIVHVRSITLVRTDHMKWSSSRLLPLIAALTWASSTWAAGSTGACVQAPMSMRAARIHAAGGPEALRVEQVPTPVPAAGDVLVRVHYASINPIDWKLQKAGRLPFPAIPGADFAGEVVALGSGVKDFACGDLVAGVVNQRERGGSYAEYLTVPVSEIVRKPAAFSLAEAAAYPTVAVAAWRYILQAAPVKAGDRVLVHGGAGGSGSVLVQIAKAKGAYVIATASPRNHEYLRGIGADEVIDYRTTRFEDVVRNVDIVVDTVGGDTLTRSVQVLRDGGRLVTLVGSVPAHIGSVPPGVCTPRIVCPVTPPWDVKKGLEAIEPFVAAGKLRINIERTYPLDAIVEAQKHNVAGSTRGKVVVDMGVAAAGKHE